MVLGDRFTPLTQTRTDNFFFEFLAHQIFIRFYTLSQKINFDKKN